MALTLRLAWRNLWRHPRRTWLTAGAMVFCNALLVFMISFQFGMYGMMIDNTLRLFSGHVQVQAPGYLDEQRMRQSVPGAAELAARLRQSLGVDNVAARASGFALVSSEQRSAGVQIIGVDPAFEPSVSTLPGLVREGRFLGANDAAEIVIGQVLARNLRAGVADELTLLGNGRDGSFAAAVVNIVGIFDSGSADLDRTLAEVPLGFFQDTFTMGDAGNSVVIRSPDQGSVVAIKQSTEALVRAEQNLVVLDWDELQPGLQQSIDADFVSAWLMYGVLTVLVAFSVLNTQLMSVLERTREFGIVMALGLTPGRLGRLVLLETALMGLLGLVLGVLLGGLVAGGLGIVGFTLPGLEEISAQYNLPDRLYPEVSPISLLLGPTVVFVATMLAAIYPALRLHWLHPVQAMRAA